ncbi:MAG TPA: hypothetical protein EYP94_06285, partial [Gammaproteobacteria bacterium]|nr:hypothetical protein [Gammaproteobacteria bacterium]
MSEEILEQTAEELEEEQQAVAESSGEEILDEAKAKVEKEEVDEEEVAEEAEEVEEAVSVPKTKAGMIKALYNQLNSMKKSDLSDSFSKIMGSTLAEEEEADEDEEETPMENKKLKKEDLEIDVKEDIEAIVNGEDLSEEFKTKAST